MKNLKELTIEEQVNTEGGSIFLAVIGGMAAGAGLYEFGYQYAKRHL